MANDDPIFTDLKRLLDEIGSSPAVSMGTLRDAVVVLLQDAVERRTQVIDGGTF